MTTDSDKNVKLERVIGLVANILTIADTLIVALFLLSRSTLYRFTAPLEELASPFRYALLFILLAGVYHIVAVLFTKATVMRTNVKGVAFIALALLSALASLVTLKCMIYGSQAISPQDLGFFATAILLGGMAFAFLVMELCKNGPKTILYVAVLSALQIFAFVIVFMVMEYE